MSSAFRQLELNGGRVLPGKTWRLHLDPAEDGYADAQLDDYGGLARRAYRWHRGTSMTLRARFSHLAGELIGTAGFGFWNAPFGDPTVGWPTLPKATWFFYASTPSDLPFPEEGAGRGWFVGTLDAVTPSAVLLAPLTPAVLVLNNFSPLRRRIWPRVRRRLNISHCPIPAMLTEWHRYALQWQPDGCRFFIDDRLFFETDCSPKGPLGFVCWLDNQYMVATPQGRFRWGTLGIDRAQWLEIADLRLTSTAVDGARRF